MSSETSRLYGGGIDPYFPYCTEAVNHFICLTQPSFMYITKFHAFCCDQASSSFGMLYQLQYIPRSSCPSHWCSIALIEEAHGSFECLIACYTFLMGMRFRIHHIQIWSVIESLHSCLLPSYFLKGAGIERASWDGLVTGMKYCKTNSCRIWCLQFLHLGLIGIGIGIGYCQYQCQHSPWLKFEGFWF